MINLGREIDLTERQLNIASYPRLRTLGGLKG